MSIENPLESFFPAKKREQISHEEAMRCIEELPIDDGAKIDILLVFKGLKRCAADLLVSLMEGDENEVQISQEEAARRLSNFESSIQRLGLFAAPGERVEHDGYAFQIYTVGSSLDETVELNQLWEDAKSDNISSEEKLALERRKGELLGFPKTAVEAFENSIALDKKMSPETRILVSELQISTEELPESVRSEDYMAFLGFIPSRGHWREELKTVQGWAQTVKETDPLLYDRVVARFRKNKRVQGADRTSSKTSFEVLRGKERAEITHLLEEGGSEALARVAQELDLDTETVALMSRFAQLRRQTHAINDAEANSRFSSEVPPTEEELQLGSYREQFEPQVRDALFVLYRKGYETVSSGFGNFLEQFISFRENANVNGFFFSDDLIRWAGERGIQILLESDVLKMRFSQFVDIETITEAWNKIAAEMPIVGEPIVLPPDKERFRRGH